ncbi:uncharacterized protein F5147DRAFT_652968 [Suillus discolor]|uniref:Uncharacterized protein n=1 Tax=Suillus discolor TaxID=1912936 RepID=A0A9P7JUC1_9AGAM|nr:uncharacterized protein F5147DRAFT_652968 [Suillus discolor]KAG2108249.1 hypothetical protein F5147DRAFT_652968 [Suillus discolor]
MAIKVANVFESCDARDFPVSVTTSTSTSDSALGPDYSIKCKQVDGFRKHRYGVWEGIVHPSGVLYYFNVSMKTYTGSDAKKYTPNQLNNLQNWIRAAHRRLQEETWYMVIKPVTREDRDYYEYYCVVLDAHTIAWFEDFNADLLFQECTFAREWNHKSKFYSPMNGSSWRHNFGENMLMSMQRSDATELPAHLEWYLAEGLILEQSTAASLFWSTDQMEKVITCLISFENLLNSDASLKEQGIAYCGRIWNILLMVLEHVKKLHVDGIVNLLDIKKFLNHFNDDNIKHSTLVGVIMAVDASILAIPNIASKSHDLQYHFTKVAIIYSAPSLL